MNPGNVQQYQRRPESLATTAARHPIMTTLGLGALALVVIGAIRFYPDFQRYLKIRNM